MSPMLDEDPELRDLFVQETRQWLNTLRRALQRLYRFPGDREALQEAQRAAHTLKGNLRMAGLEAPASLAARLHAAFRTALNAKAPPTSADIVLWAQWTDTLSRQLVPYGVPYIGHTTTQNKV